MPDSNDDILLKLESTINGWSEEVTSAHSRLTHQITDTKDQLSALLKVIAARGKSGSALEKSQEQAAQLKGELEQRDEALASLNAAGEARDAQFEALAEIQAKLKAENDELRGQLAESESARQSVESKAGTLEEEVQGLRAQVDGLNLESARVPDEKTALESETAALRTQLTESGAALETLEAEHEALRGRSEEQAKAHEQTQGAMQSLQEERDTLAQSGEDAREKLEGLQDLMSEAADAQERLDADRECLGEEITQIKAVLDETRGELEAVQDQLRQTLEARDALAEQIGEHLDTTSSQKRDLESGKEAFDTLRTTLNEKETALEGAMAEAGAFLKELENRTQAEAVTTKRMAELEEVHEHERAGHEQAKAEHDSLNEELALERGHCEELRTELDSLRALKETSDEELRLASDSLDALRLRENQRETDLSGELEAAQEAAQTELARKEAAQSAVEDELLEARNRYNALQDRLEAHAGSERECVRLTETVGALKAEIEGYKRQFAALDQSRESDSFQAEVDAMEVEELRLELRTHRALVRDRKESVETLKEDRQKLEASVNESDAALQETREKVQELRAGIASRERTILSNKERIMEVEHALRSGEDRSRALSEECSEMRLHAGLLDEAQQEIARLEQALARRDETLSTLQREQEAAPVPVEAERIPLAAYDAQGRKRSMGEILVNAGIITEKQLESALEEQRSSKQRRLGTILTEKGLIQEQIVAQVLASQVKLPFVEIGNASFEPEVVNLISGERATHHMCIPMTLTSEGLTLAMANPLDVVAIEDIEIIAGHTILAVVATLADITSAIVRHYGSHTAVESLQAP